MSQFPLFDSIMSELGETQKKTLLSDKDVNDCCLEIKTFDKNSFEILYALIKTYEVHSTPSNTCRLPYDSKELKTGIKKLLQENPFYYECPAAKRYHHAYKHGLLEHSTQIIDLAFGMMKTFDAGIAINRDLIIAGSMLHDVGKINCYKLVEGGIDVCPTISEQDHIINGVKLVSKYIQSNQVDQLLHIIASHHKEKQYGSPVSPISNEAWIITVTDDLSSKIMG